MERYYYSDHVSSAELRDVRTKLMAFYGKYNPERIGDIDKILYSFHGREEELFEGLLKKYAPYGDQQLGLKPLPAHTIATIQPKPTQPQSQPQHKPQSPLVATPSRSPPPQQGSSFPPPSPPPPPSRSSDTPQPVALQPPSPAPPPKVVQQNSPAPPPPLFDRQDADHDDDRSPSSQPMGEEPANEAAEGSPVNKRSSLARRRHSRAIRPSQVGFKVGAPPLPSDAPESVIAAAKRSMSDENFFPQKPRTRSLVEVTDETLQQAHSELSRVSDALLAIEPLDFQRLLSTHVDLAIRLAAMENEDADEAEIDRVEDDLQRTQNRLIGAVTQLQHAVKGFMSIASNVMQYSQQQSDLQALRARREAELEAHRRRDFVEGGAGPANLPSRFAVSEYDKHYQQTSSRPKSHSGLESASHRGMMGNDSLRPPMVSSSAGSPSRGVSADVSLGGVSSAAKVVFDVFPLGGEKNVVADVILNQASPGDVIVLHPGEYRENMVVQADVEIRCALDSSTVAANSADASRDVVTITPADPNTPALQVVGDGVCRLSGVVFRRPQDDRAALLAVKADPRHRRGTGTAFLSSATITPAVPLISVTGRGQISLRDVCCSGGGGGLVCLGHSQARLHHCTFRRCTFGGVYVKDAAFATISGTSFLECDVALRVRDATFSLESCEIRDSHSDSLAFHGPVKGIVAKTRIDGSEDNGAMLSPSSEVVFSNCVIQRSRKHGVYAPLGADFALVGCSFADNGLGDASRQPPLESSLAARHNLN
jgi:hypothetical protein